MPRPPKNKAIPEPVAPAAVPVNVPIAAPPAALTFKAPPVIDVDQFIRVRDSVYQRLQTIQDLIRSFSQDYLRQTNLLIGEGTNLENGGPELAAGLAGIAGTLVNLAPAALAPPQPAVEEKKERKKRTHDPNAPKRPLTPYFLYMQTARPIIANDLGDQVPKGAVQDEGQRRWSVMTPAEKLGWNQAYQYNLRLYNARVHSYKQQNNLEAKNMTDEEARIYADANGIGLPLLNQGEEAQPNDQQAIAEQLQLAAAAQAPPEEASEEEKAPAAKTPKKKETRKRKSTAVATPASAAPAAEPEPPKSAVATPASPEAKKRKRVSKAAEQVEEPKKSGRKKAKSG